VAHSKGLHTKNKKKGQREGVTRYMQFPGRNFLKKKGA